MLYTYDQLNRIKPSSHQSVDVSQPQNRGAGKYGTQYQYDANGNIMNLVRRDENGLPIIDIGYRYNYNTPNKLLVNNHLQNVSGSQGRVRNTDYEYDLIGNLTRSEELDEQNETTIDFITWTVYGKVVQKQNGNEFVSITYQYDGGGNRILKTVEADGFTSVTHYVRDASGNILATYDNTQLEEFNIYGASRLGNYKPNEDQNDYGKLILGFRNYELSNHLGNVLAVISDKKFANGQAEVVSANDYYPFGMTITNRSFDGNYRFGFQGQESESELFGGEGTWFKYRASDNRLGRFFAIDPLSSNFPWNSSYAFSENTLMAFIKLERLKIKQKMNHFALKSHLYVKRIQTAMHEIQVLRTQKL